MSRHNYSQYSNNRKKQNPKPYERSHETAHEVKMELDEPVVLMGPIEVASIEETVDTVALPETVEGVVVNCSKLNVRAQPSINAEIVCVLDAMSEIEIDVAKSTAEWFHVCTATGVEGYCMRKFVDAHL